MLKHHFHGHGWSRVYPGNTASEAGVHPRWDSSPSQESMIILIHISRQLRVSGPPAGMFREVGGNWRTKRKPIWTEGEHVKCHIYSKPSSVWNQEPWSCEVATHTVPLCQPVKDSKQKSKYHNLEEKLFL